ncbi:MAG: helix-turn-helix transcriptional regulator [Gemmatimonadetes bacterium]|nr:helix-turn-helix transcriptional regulator [Gemmatimonadota bacterium]MXX73332.1 helix-turn-helix transcriptional regulator [Gemmatimonadota bacterium]MYC90007.1 helix-turn-helix transcriptional regulator [Gemmatimonadota bacterium]MYG35797.1 helix-turn-helix transcriptional regulator [Gemmatimonadota bacterium]MYJ18318.1 helix-turn-helix transcriptional regulator [Gemmatimonadota bacterium]
MPRNIGLEDPVFLLGPPYHQLARIDVDDTPQVLEGGWVMAWHLGSPGWQRAAPAVAGRPAGVPLAIILPDGEDRLSVLRVLRAIEQSRPQAVMPYHEAPTAREIASVIRREPSCLASSVADYLVWRGIPLDAITRSIIRRTVQLSSQVRTIGALAKNLYMSRRALGRKLLSSELPVASHWLHISRILRATITLQNSEASLFRVAVSLGYSDGFSLSNQMYRLCGIRPMEARERLGWEWVFETWLAREVTAGSIGAPIASGRPSIASFSRKTRVEASVAGAP